MRHHANGLASVCIVSIIRLKSLSVLLKGSDLTCRFLWFLVALILPANIYLADTINALLWCVVELNVSIIGGCAPTLPPLIRRYFPSLLGSSGGFYGSGNVRNGRGFQGHSHQLQSFEISGLTPKNEKAGIVIRGGDVTGIENDSEEHIIQYRNTSQEGLSPGKIRKTVDFGYKVTSMPKESRKPGDEDVVAEENGGTSWRK